MNLDLKASARSALRWLAEHNSDGCFDKTRVLLAAGERAPFMYATWKYLEDAGAVEFYQDRKRVRIREGIEVDRSAPLPPHVDP